MRVVQLFELFTHSLATALLLVHWALSLIFYVVTVTFFSRRKDEDVDNPYRKVSQILLSPCPAR